LDLNFGKKMDLLSHKSLGVGQDRMAQEDCGFKKYFTNRFLIRVMQNEFLIYCNVNCEKKIRHSKKERFL
jgi:hypothetical protein